MKITLDLTPAEFRALLLPSAVDDKIREWNEAAARVQLLPGNPSAANPALRQGFDNSFPSLDPTAKPHKYEQAEMSACCKWCGGGKDHGIHSVGNHGEIPAFYKPENS